MAPSSLNVRGVVCGLVTMALLANCSVAVDMNLWEQVLQRHVSPGAQLGVAINVVNYVGLKEDSDFHAFINQLASADLASLSRNESFTLGINAYNAFAAKTLMDFACKYESNEEQTGKCLGPAYGLPDIQIGNFTGFTKKMHNLAGTIYSLNDIEEMMRPVPSAPLFSAPIDTTEDLRVHCSLICDGTSCPNLFPFKTDTIDMNMDHACEDWMGNPWKGLRIDTATNTVHLSKIMSWFSDEFEAQGGVVQAFGRFFPTDARAYFAEEPQYNIEYMGYIWDANGPVPCSCVPSVVDSVGVKEECHIKGGTASRLVRRTLRVQQSVF